MFSYISWICLGLVLSPRSGIELGGTKIFIGGPCYDPNDQIVCRFNNTLETTAVYVSPEIAYCVTPPLYVVGLIQVELSLDGGTTFKYTGTFRSSELILDILFRYRLFSHSLQYRNNFTLLQIIQACNFSVHLLIFKMFLYEYGMESNKRKSTVGKS